MTIDQSCKQNENKWPMTRILWKPIRWFLQIRLYGFRKYKSWDNFRDVDIEDWFAAALRHLMAYADGQIFDPESGYPHIAHALTNLMYLAEADLPEPPGPLYETLRGKNADS